MLNRICRNDLHGTRDNKIYTSIEKALDAFQSCVCSLKYACIYRQFSLNLAQKLLFGKGGFVRKGVREYFGDLTGGFLTLKFPIFHLLKY